MSDSKPVTIPSSSSLYNEVAELLAKAQYEQAVQKISPLMNVKSALKARGSTQFEVEDGFVKIDGELLPSALSKRLIQFTEASIDYAPLVAFWNNLKKNPSSESRNSLYGFLEANKIPITSKGTFIAYKSVKKDFFDSHSGKFDNTPGNIVKMNRDEVDSNRNQTCSYGLHVAAYSYAKNFADLLLEVEVNPKDVVAVPPDYNNQKMRVCEYKVLRVAPGHERQEEVYDDPTYEDDAAIDFSEEIVNQSQRIVRLSAALKKVEINGRNQVVVPLPILQRFNKNVGDTVGIQIQSEVLVINPNKCNSTAELKIGGTGLLIPTDILREANLYGESSRKLTFVATKGTLELRLK